MLFSQFCHYLDKIEAITSRNQITDTLKELFSQLNTQEIGLACYMLQGQLTPNFEPCNFFLADKQLEKFITDFITEHQPEQITNFKQAYHATGDIGSALDHVAQVFPNDQDSSLGEIYDQLKLLTQATGNNAVARKKEIFYHLFAIQPSLSLKYICRIVLAKLRLGFSDMTILDALSCLANNDKKLKKTLENAYNVCADLGKIATLVKSDQLEIIAHMQPVLLIPVRPAAAERLESMQEIAIKLGNFVAQPKLDGLRLQIHKHTDLETGRISVRMFSRNLVDVSTGFQDLAQAIKNISVSNFIIEGEVVAYDYQTQKAMAFQDTSKRRRKNHTEQAIADFPVRFYIFDLLYLEKSFLNSTHQERRQVLETNFSFDDKHPIQVLEEFRFAPESTIEQLAEQLEEIFLQARAQGHEGLVIKKTDAVYQAGKRNFNWVKLKYLTHSSLPDTIDTVVIGYYKGGGKRAAFGIGALLLGVFNPQTQTFQTIAKLGTGLTDKEWIDIRAELAPTENNLMPHNFQVSKDLYPEIWVHPTVVLEVAADQITLSPNHTAGKSDTQSGYALRFPRLVKKRPDKNCYQTTDLNEIKSMLQQEII